MDDYPRTAAEFEARFATEEACRAYLCRLRWPDGFRCRCGEANAWWTARGLWQCAACGAQTSVTAGTVFQDTRKPLRLFAGTATGWGHFSQGDSPHREYLREKQRSQPGCIAVRMQMELHHGLLG